MYELDLGSCELELILVARSDILVNSPDQETPFFRGIDPRTGEPTYLIPATSLKGVLRGTSERILRTFHPHWACDPLTVAGEQSEASRAAGLLEACSKRLEKWQGGAAALYRALCPACRLFGATVFKGLIAIDDAVPLRSERGAVGLEARTRIAIDRWTGAIRSTARGSGATQKVKVLPARSRFGATIRLHNFSLWQLGLLALALRELNEERAGIGSGTRKGMGCVRAKPQRMVFRYPAARYARASPPGEGGILCAPQHLLSDPLEPLAPGEEPWFGAGLTATPDAPWYDRGWTTVEVPREKTGAIFRHAVEKGFKPWIQARQAADTDRATDARSSV